MDNVHPSFILPLIHLLSTPFWLYFVSITIVRRRFPLKEGRPHIVVFTGKKNLSLLFTISFQFQPFFLLSPSYEIQSLLDLHLFYTPLWLCPIAIRIVRWKFSFKGGWLHIFHYSLPSPSNSNLCCYYLHSTTSNHD